MAMATKIVESNMLNTTTGGNHLQFPEFKDIKVSTKTFTVNTNLIIDLHKLFDILPVTEYVLVPKKRGRKKKTEVIDPNKNIAYGSIITVKDQHMIKGVDLNPPKKSKNMKKKWFRNSITVVIILDKRINFKICKNGTFQMTGCKNTEHPELCVKCIWEYIKNYPDIYTFTRGTHLEALIVPSMRNVDFSLGFIVDREKLVNYISEQTKYNWYLEISNKYTGVNTKIPLHKDMTELKINKIEYTNNDWKHTITTYQDYLDILSLKDRLSKLREPKFTSFLIFHSGRVIVSGLTEDYTEHNYRYFINIMREIFDIIEERLDPIDNSMGNLTFCM